jgi:SIKE family
MADLLMNETERVNYQLDSMRQFQDDLNALNILARERSNHDIIGILVQENPQIREIQAENRQLKASIEEHQRAIELIMTKYRQHTQQQIQETRLDFERLVKANENNNVSFRECSDKNCANIYYLRLVVHKHHQLPSGEAPRSNLSHASSYPRL